MHTTPVSLLVILSEPREERQGPEATRSWEDGWRRFVELYTPLLYSWARKQARLDHNDAADLVQEVLVLLVRKLPEFRYDPERSFRGWMRTVLIRRWCELKRRKHERPLGNPSDSILEKLPAAPETLLFEETEYRQYIAGRAWELVRGEYNATTQRVFEEVIRKGRPRAEVAAELNLTRAAIDQAVSRVLRRLREEFGGFLD